MPRVARSRPSIACCVISLLAFCTSAAPGQTSQPSSAPTSPIIPLAPLTDRAAGYELLAPAGWTYDHTQFAGPGRARGLLRGVSPDGETTLQVLLFRGPEALSVRTFVQYFARELHAIDGTTEIRVEPAETFAAPSSAAIDPGEVVSHASVINLVPGAYVDVVARVQKNRTRTVYLVRAYDENAVLVVSLGGVLDPAPAAGADPAETPIPETFRRIAASLRVTYSPELEKQIKAAIERGREFVRARKIVSGIPRLQIDDALRFYIIEFDGKPTGYLTRRFTREDEPVASNKGPHRDGLRVREVSWRFGPAEGLASESTLNVFATLDGKAEFGEQIVTSVPPTGAANPLPVTGRMQFIRESDSIVTTLTADVTGPARTPSRTLGADTSYASAAWLRVLPALIGQQPSDYYGFMILDSEAQTLIPHTIRALGEKALPLGGAAGKTYAYELRDGYGAAGLVYTDESGHWLRFELGSLTVRLAQADEIERHFASLRKAALVRIGAVPGK